MCLKEGAFNGLSQTYQSYHDYGRNMNQKEMDVSSGHVEITKITFGTFFEGKENSEFEERQSKLQVTLKSWV